MKRRDFLKAAGVGLVASTTAAPAIAQSHVTFVVAHGAWSAGWAWKKMHPLMTASGHRLVTPTYTGLGEREHLASPSNDLETHIQDVLAVLKMPISRCREATFIANVSDLATLSVRSPSAPRAKLDGATTKSTPAIRRMSSRPRRSPRFCRRS